jgi:hypothetical protein
MLDHYESARKALELIGANSAMRQYLESENRWKAEMEKMMRPVSAMEQMIASMKPPPGLLDAVSRFHADASAACLAKEYSQYNNIATLLKSFDLSIGNAATRIAADVVATQRLTIDQFAGHSGLLDAAASFARQNEEMHKSMKDLARLATIRASTSSIAGAFGHHQHEIVEISRRLTASVDFAHIAGNVSMASAFDNAFASISQQYATGQLDQIRNHAAAIVGSMPSFDFNTINVIAKFHGIEGIAKQLASLGLRPEEYLGQAAIDTVESEPGNGDGFETTIGWAAPRFDDLRQLAINLIAQLLWVVFISSLLANPDMDTLNRRFDKVEELIGQIPQLLATQVENAVRKELAGDIRASFVVRDRMAKLREAPVAGSTVVTMLFPNQVLTLLEEKGQWIRVEFYDYLAQDAKEGWVLKKYCQRMPARFIPKAPGGNDD